MSLPAPIYEAGSATESDIRIGRGESQRLRLEITDKTGAILPLPGVTSSEVRIYSADGSTLLLTLAATVETPDTLGQIYADITAAESLSLPFAPDDPLQQHDLRARWAWWVSGAGSQARVVARGRINVISDLDP